jgi:hypothetical protein
MSHQVPRVRPPLVYKGLRLYRHSEDVFAHDDGSAVDFRCYRYVNHDMITRAFLHDKRYKDRQERSNARSFMNDVKGARPCLGCGVGGGNNCITKGCDVGKMGCGYKSVAFGIYGTYSQTILLVVVVEYIHTTLYY